MVKRLKVCLYFLNYSFIAFNMNFLRGYSFFEFDFVCFLDLFDL